MDGEIINLFVYDAGVALPFDKVKNLLKNPEDFSKVEYNTPAPEEIPTFSVPFVFNLKETELSAGGRNIRVKRQIAIYELGAFSIRLRVKMDGVDVKFLADMAFSKGWAEAMNGLADKTRHAVEGDLAKVASIKTESRNEMYTFYFINGTKDQVIKDNRALLAGLLVDEKSPDALDKEYIEDVLSKSISYNFDDAFFVGWEGAVLLDKLKKYDYELLMAEIANVQLLKMRIARARISTMLEQTSRSVAEINGLGLVGRLISGKATALHVKLAAFSDETLETMNKIENTAFGLGEWYLARIYVLFANVFKLEALEDSIKNDMETINGRKAIAEAAINRKHADSLEAIVIVLIVIEVALEVLFLLK